MARRIKLATKLSVEELERRSRSTSEGMERSHWQIIGLLARGHPAYEVAQMTGYSAYWIGQIARRFNDEGEEALVNHRKRSRPSPQALLATAADLDELRRAVSGPAPHGDGWNSRTVAGWLSARAGRPVSTDAALAYLHKRTWTPQTPRPRHVKAADAAEQEAFKKPSGAK